MFLPSIGSLAKVLHNQRVKVVKVTSHGLEGVWGDFHSSKGIYFQSFFRNSEIISSVDLDKIRGMNFKIGYGVSVKHDSPSSVAFNGIVTSIEQTGVWIDSNKAVMFFHFNDLKEIMNNSNSNKLLPPIGAILKLKTGTLEKNMFSDIIFEGKVIEHLGKDWFSAEVYKVNEHNIKTARVQFHVDSIVSQETTETTGSVKNSENLPMVIAKNEPPAISEIIKENPKQTKTPVIGETVLVKSKTYGSDLFEGVVCEYGKNNFFWVEVNKINNKKALDNPRLMFHFNHIVKKQFVVVIMQKGQPFGSVHLCSKTDFLENEMIEKVLKKYAKKNNLKSEELMAFDVPYVS